MAKFEVYNKCAPVAQGITLERVTDMIITSLNKAYYLGSMTRTETGMSLKGNLTGTFERSITRAEVEIFIENDELHYQVTGTTSLGKWAWFWFVVGLFTGFAMGIFLFMAVTYITSKDKPKACFEDAFKAVQYELC